MASKNDSGLKFEVRLRNVPYKHCGLGGMFVFSGIFVGEHGIYGLINERFCGK